MPVGPNWSDDGRPHWVPAWIPSLASLKHPWKASIVNMQSNLQYKDKPHLELGIELTIVIIEFTAFITAMLGFVPGYLPYNLTQVAGLALMGVGVFFFLSAVAQVGGKLSFLHTPLTAEHVATMGGEATRVVKDGVYAHCRHPMYFGVLSFALGVAMLLLSVERLFGVVILYIVLDYKADLEELILVESNLDGYEAYAKAKPKFIPGARLLLTSRQQGYTAFADERGGRENFELVGGHGRDDNFRPDQIAE